MAAKASTSAALGGALAGAPAGFTCSQPPGHVYACRTTNKTKRDQVKKLQTTLNALIQTARQRGTGNFTALILAVDGVVGPATTATAAAIGTLALNEDSSLPIDSKAKAAIMTPSPEAIAGSVAALSVFFAEVAKRMSVGVGVAAEPPTASPNKPSDVTPLPQTADDPEQGKSNTLWWVVGGALLLGATYLGYRMYRGGDLALAGGDDSDDEDYGYSEASDDFIDV